MGRTGRRGNPETLARRLAREGPLSVPRALEVIEALVQQVSELHDAGRIHRAIATDSAAFDPQLQPYLYPGPRLVPFGGPQADSFAAPPELQLRRRVFLPEELDAARDVLAEAGAAIDPRRIDIYQLGAVLAETVTGLPIARYLSSPQVAGTLQAPVRSVIDATVGFQSSHRVNSCGELRALLDTLHDDRPPPVEDASSSVPSGEDPPAPHEEPVAPPLPAEVNFQRLGHFRIERAIGSGGMGDVFLGHDETLGRPVAVKVLPAELARHEDYVRRFHAEASAAAKLAHPNIVPIHFIGQDGPHHFFAMQYVDGESLADRLRRETRLASDETVRLIEDCLQGLDVAHGQGLIHRDIKPANILLDAKTGRAMLADFGLVRRVNQSTRLTATGMVMGTVDYIAPEQARGLPVDSRTDLYSLGVLLYQLLAGRLPFEADTPTAMLFQHAYETPPALRQIAPHVPEPLAVIATRLMAKQPQDRYQSCERVLADLAAYRQGGPVPPPQPSPEDGTSSAGHLGGQPQAPGWWRAAADRAYSLFRAHSPELAEVLLNTEQHVDGAIAEYGRRRQEVVQLIGEAKAARDGLAQQAGLYQDAVGSAEHRIANSRSDAERVEAEQERQQRIDAVNEINTQLLAHDDQIAELEIQLSRIDAKLASLQSQRDLLLARLQVARAQQGVRKRRPPSSTRIAVFAAIGSLVVAAGLWLLFFAATPTTDQPGVRASGHETAELIERQWKRANEPVAAPDRPPDSPQTAASPPSTSPPAASRSEPVPEVAPRSDSVARFKPSPKLLEQIKTAPVIITDFEPKDAARDEVITVHGRGFHDVTSVSFTAFERHEAEFSIVSSEELKVRVPRHVFAVRDGRTMLASMTVVTPRGTTVTVPPETFVMNAMFDSVAFDAAWREAPKESHWCHLVEPGFFGEVRNYASTTIVNEGARLNYVPSAEGNQFVRNGARIKGRGSHGVVYHEPQADLSSFAGGYFLKVVQTPVIVPSPVDALFRFVPRPEPEDDGDDRLPVLTDVQPRVGGERHGIVLHGRGFAGARVLVYGHQHNGVIFGYKPSYAWVNSDTEIHVRLFNEGLSRFIIHHPNGLFVSAPPNPRRVTEFVDNAQADFVIVESGAAVGLTVGELTLIEKGAAVQRSTQVTLVRSGGKLGVAKQGVVYYEPGAILPADREDASFVEVPKFDIHESNLTYRSFSAYDLTPRTSWPVAAWLKAVANSGYADPLFREVYSRQLTGSFNEEQWKYLFHRDHAFFTDIIEVEDVHVRSFMAYSFEGDDHRGQVTVRFRNEIKLTVPVVNEDGQWRAAEFITPLAWSLGRAAPPTPAAGGGGSSSGGGGFGPRGE